MNCDICGKQDLKWIVILPIHQSDGKLDTVACDGCARRSKAYCNKHWRTHQGFMDGSTACIYCVEELVKAHKDSAEVVRNRLVEALPPDEAEKLYNAATISAGIMDSIVSVAVLRFIASKAFRSNQSLEEVTREIVESRSVSCILW